MEKLNNHQVIEEEIQEEEVHTRAEDPIDSSDASDYEWEREMQEIWKDLDEAYVEAYEEDPIEEHVEAEVDVVNVTPRPDSDKKPRSLATYHVTARAT